MSSAFDSSWDFLKALKPIPNIPEIEHADTPENELRHYNNMQQQKARFVTRPPPGPRETDRMREAQAMEEETDEEGQYTGDTPPMSDRPRNPNWSAPLAQRLASAPSPPRLEHAPPPNPLNTQSGQEMMESKLLQGLGPLSMGGTGPTRKSVAFARAWGLLKAGKAPEWSSTDRGYSDDEQFFNPLDSPQGHPGHEEPYTEQEIADWHARNDRAIARQLANATHGGPKANKLIDSEMEMSDEDYLNMLLGEGKGPKMHELVDQGAEMELGDIAGMGEEGAEMARHHLERGPAAGQSRAQPPIDVPPAPPQMPPKGQRTLDEF